MMKFISESLFTHIFFIAAGVFDDCQRAGAVDPPKGFPNCLRCVRYRASGRGFREENVDFSPGNVCVSNGNAKTESASYSCGLADI
jgi:hypothetical protein